MKAPYRIGIPPQLNALYIERYKKEPAIIVETSSFPQYESIKKVQTPAIEGYWRLPIHTDPTHTLGTFLHLYDDGRIEQVTVRVDRGDETITIKPKD